MSSAWSAASPAVSPEALLVEFLVGLLVAQAQAHRPLRSRRARCASAVNVMQASLIRQPMPVYPQIAKTAHISGTVVLHAIIGADGAVQDLQYISGPPLLMRSAMDAVRQWRYRPTMLNGEPTAVDTTVSVVFTLGG